jgi:Ca2+-binding RTX toxin-like protein
MRLSRVLVLALLPLGMVTLPQGPAAVGAPANCQGQPATITSDGGAVTGTEGDDVISTTGVVTINALGGADRICIERGTANAGAGGDSVLSTATSCCTSLTVDLGPGDDTYNGTLGAVVINGDASGTDTITAGIGNDSVVSGAEGEPNLDVIDLGLGNDVLSARLPAGSDVDADGGGGYDHVSVFGTEVQSGDWEVHLAGPYARNGVQLASFTSFFDHALTYGAEAHVAVTGTSGPDSVRLGSGSFDVDLAGGDDHVTVDSFPGTVSGEIEAGTGHDGLALGGGTVNADLTSGTVRFGDRSVQISGFEVHRLTSTVVRVRGSEGADDIQVTACKVRVNGDDGDDDISYLPFEDFGCDQLRILLQGGPGRDVLTGSGKPERLEGGRGDDRLYGGKNRDELIGGAGRDRADGDAGNDRCVAEVEKRCER